MVGGGPVGSLLAGELLLAGAAVTVLERATGPVSASIPRVLHARTLELLDRRGLLDELESAADARRVGATRFAQLWGLDLGALDSERPYGLELAHGTVVTALREWAQRLGADLRLGHVVENFGQDYGSAWVDVRTADSARPYRLRGGFVVGCDGGHSTVRKRSGIAFGGTGPTAAATLAATEPAEPASLPVGWRRFAGGYVISGPGVVGTLEFGAPPPEPARDIDELAARIRRLSGIDVRLSAPRWLAAFTDNARQADSYRAGRLLLAGDSAHVHFPAGGQGLNLGIADAISLGWRLAGQLCGWAPPGLLDGYQNERRPAATRVLDAARVQLELLRPDPTGEAWRRIFGELTGVPAASAALARMVAGVDVAYPPAGGNGNALIGRFAPDMPLLDGTGRTRLAEALRRARPVLVCSQAERALREAARAWPLVAVYAPAERQVSDSVAMLVRPDGYLAWAASGDGDDTGGLAAALRDWFGSPRGAARSQVSSSRSFSRG